jgi:putative ABC transport system substrate-binding protein
MRIAMSLVLAVGLALFAGEVDAASANAQQRSVAVLASTDQPAFNAVRDGIQDSLKAAGFDAAKSLKWQYRSAHGDSDTARTIASEYADAHPDAIVAIGAMAAREMLAASSKAPLVYAAVSDPIAARLVKDWGASGTNITGVADVVPLDRQIDLIKQVAPNAKRVGIVYNPGNPDSVSIVKQLQELLPKAGLTLVEVLASHAEDVGSAGRNLIGRVDIIYAGADDTVASAFESLAQVANEARVPLISADTSNVARGAVAALGINYRELGQEAGKIVVRILKGEKPGAIASEAIRKLELVVNSSAADKQGVTLPAQLVQSAAHLVK